MMNKQPLQIYIYTVIVIDQDGRTWYYVGQTSRDLMQRMNEHRKAIREGIDNTDGEARRFYKAAAEALMIYWPDCDEIAKPGTFTVNADKANAAEMGMIACYTKIGKSLNTTPGGTTQPAKAKLNLYQIDKDTGEILDACTCDGYDHAAQIIQRTEGKSNQYTIARNLRQIGFDRLRVGTRSMRHTYTIGTN